MQVRLAAGQVKLDIKLFSNFVFFFGGRSDGTGHVGVRPVAVVHGLVALFNNITRRYYY